MIPEENLQHSSFSQPTDGKCSVWRYMDFAKFVSLLDTQSLYYCRVDRLLDPFEGCAGRASLSAMEEKIGIVTHNRPFVWSQFVTMARTHYVSCWCVQQHESDALWRIYAARSTSGIAIRTTYFKLVEALPETDFIGLVRYFDYDSEPFDPTNIMNFIMSKRKQFSYENEMRIVRTPYNPKILPTDSSTGSVDFAAGPPRQAVRVSVNSLLDQIVVGPYTTKWLEDTVRATADRFGCTVPITRSSLAEKPHVGPAVE